jgi:hypothetical protein
MSFWIGVAVGLAVGLSIGVAGIAYALLHRDRRDAERAREEHQRKIVGRMSREGQMN